MEKKGFINKFFQNAGKPEGFLGRMILRGMNTGHAPLSRWARSCLVWQPEWNTLDIGCGGGANLSEILKLCPQGKVHGIDISQESVAFARKKNMKHLGTRCFVDQGSADRLPYADNSFDVVTAFETIYFWGDLHRAFIEVKRVLKDNGFFLICCEASDPTNETWTSRIEGMVVHPSSELKYILAQSGFTNITLHRKNKEDLCIVAQKQSSNN